MALCATKTKTAPMGRAAMPPVPRAVSGKSSSKAPTLEDRLADMQRAAQPIEAPVADDKKTALGSKDMRCYGTMYAPKPQLNIRIPPSEKELEIRAELAELSATVAESEKRQETKEDPYANATAWAERQLAELAKRPLTAVELCEAQKRVIGLLNAFIEGDKGALKGAAGVRFSINGEEFAPDRPAPPPRKWWGLWGLTF